MATLGELICNEDEDFGPTVIVTSTGRADGVRVDITGFALTFVVHRLPGDNAPLLTYSTSGGSIAVPLGTDGAFVVSIPNADIMSIGVGDYYFYAARVDPGSRACYVKGPFTVRAV